MKKTEVYLLGKTYGLSPNQIEQILIFITGLNKSQLFLLGDIDKKIAKKLLVCFKKFKQKIPFEYIINSSIFYSIDFYVDKRVLIPRNDTEIMVDSILSTITNNDFLIDVGTGSGAINIAVNKNIALKGSLGLDISKKALQVTKINIEKNNLQDKISLLRSDLLKVLFKNKIKIESDNIYIRANLPYIKDKDYKVMDESVIKYEPKIALYGGKKTGFEMYEKLIKQILKLKQNDYNNKNIYLFIEIGFDQYDYTLSYLSKLGLKFEVFKDNFGINRCVKIYF